MMVDRHDRRSFTTQIRPLSDPAAQAAAVALLDAGQVIAAPTDTVYGVFCRTRDAAAIAHLYAVKDRPPEKAIPVLIGAISDLAALVRTPLPPGADVLMDAFWPGPLTLVLPAQPHLPPVLTAGQPSLAVRMPAHAALCALLRRTGPLAATSANRSGAAEAHTAVEVLAQLAGRLPLILADSPDVARPDSLPSTIVDLADPGGPRLLRPGPLAAEVAAALAAAGLALDPPGVEPHADRR
jgi:L-threonylcarbamoyladenylate synthase